MAAEEGIKTERTSNYSISSRDKKSVIVQPHMVDSNTSSHLSSDLTPVFDREQNLKLPDAVYNEASSEESDYNQSSVIFSLDELQNSLVGLRSSISPEVPSADHKSSSAGLLFPSLIQDEEKSSVSSKEDEEESDQNNDEFSLISDSSPIEDCPIRNGIKGDEPNNNIPVENKVTKCSTQTANVGAQPDTVVTSDDSLLCHSNSSSSPAAVDSTAVNTISSNVTSIPVTIHPKSHICTTHMEDTSLNNVVLEDNSYCNSKFSSIDASHVDRQPLVETAHVEIPSGIATITHSSPAKTPNASNRTELPAETELSDSISSSNPDSISVHQEKPIDSFGISTSLASGKSLSEKLKPTQNTFESPGLLYAHRVKKSSKNVVETLEPAETATEALLAEEKLPVVTSQGGHHVEARADNRGELFIDQTHLSSFNYKNISAGIPLFYPPDRMSNTAAADEILLDDSVLRDIETNAKKVAENLDYMLDNLRYSLHAMATCTKLSVSLHKEAIDDMHVTVDESIKV